MEIKFKFKCIQTWEQARSLLVLMLMLLLMLSVAVAVQLAISNRMAPKKRRTAGHCRTV